MEEYSQSHQLSSYWVIALQNTGLALVKILGYRFSRHWLNAFLGHWGYRFSRYWVIALQETWLKLHCKMARRADNYAYWRSCLKKGWSLESGASSPKGMCRGGTGRTIK
jgi:hypothetical protein